MKKDMMIGTTLLSEYDYDDYDDYVYDIMMIMAIRIIMMQIMKISGVSHNQRGVLQRGMLDQLYSPVRKHCH